MEAEQVESRAAEFLEYLEAGGLAWHRNRQCSVLRQLFVDLAVTRSEEHTSELQSPVVISYAVG